MFKYISNIAEFSESFIEHNEFIDRKIPIVEQRYSSLIFQAHTSYFQDRIFHKLNHCMFVFY